jgi:hypothetical protein
VVETATRSGAAEVALDSATRVQASALVQLTSTAAPTEDGSVVETQDRPPSAVQATVCPVLPSPAAVHTFALRHEIDERMDAYESNAGMGATSEAVRPPLVTLTMPLTPVT